jgi:hypothetical protein
MNTVHQRIIRYFQAIADELEAKGKKAAVLSNNPDRGTSRENTLENFLAQHIPSRCQVKTGGFIFDVRGTESHQIDLLVTNDLTLQLVEQGKSFNCVEGVYCAISVKTRLDKQSLLEAFENLASIPPMPDMVDRISGQIANPQKYNDFPLCVIFAYDGLDWRTIAKHLGDFYENNPQIPASRRADMIIVNNKYVISRTEAEVRRVDGTKIPPNTYVGEADPQYYPGATALLRLLIGIQRSAFIGPHLSMNFGEYLDAIGISIRKDSE